MTILAPPLGGSASHEGNAVKVTYGGVHAWVGAHLRRPGDAALEGTFAPASWQVWVQVEGTRTDISTAAFLHALGADRPTWLTFAQAVQAGLDADPDVHPADVLTFARRGTADKTGLVRCFTPTPWQWHCLAADRAAAVRLAVAREVDRRALPDAVLGRLSRDEDPQVRVEVARRLRHEHHHMLTLAHDLSLKVRSALATNVMTPAPVHHILAQDARWTVRLCLAEREDLDAVTQTLLASDAHPRVCQALANRERLYTEAASLLARHPATSVRWSRARHHNLRSPDTITLSTDRAVSVRCALASTQAPLSEDVMLTLATDRHEDVRATLARRADLPMRLREALSADRSCVVAAAALGVDGLAAA